MTEKELLAKIRLLKEIKPGKEWVLLTKTRILGKEEDYRARFSILDLFLLKWHPALVMPILMISVVFGLTFTMSQSSVPGDFLYPVKKITETTQVNFSPENERTKLHLELANRRLEDLNRIAETNKVRNLAPTIKEFQESVSLAAKDLTRMGATTSSDPNLIRDIVFETQKLAEQKEKVEALGIEIGDTKEWDSALNQLVEREIGDLEGRTLTEKQQNLLAKAKEDYEEGNYPQALEKILLLQNNY